MMENEAKLGPRGRKKRMQKRKKEERAENARRKEQMLRARMIALERLKEKHRGIRTGYVERVKEHRRHLLAGLESGSSESGGSRRSGRFRFFRGGKAPGAVEPVKRPTWLRSGSSKESEAASATERRKRLAEWPW